MKINLFVSIALVLSLSSALAGIPTYETLSSSLSIDSQLQYYSNGVYYFGTQYYNVTTGKITAEILPVNCSAYPAFTYSVVPYCYKYVYDSVSREYTYYLSFLDAELNRTTSTYKIASFSHQVTFSIELSDRFILFEFLDYTTGAYNFSVYPFDLSSNSVACSKENISTNAGFQSIYTNGNNIIYSYLDSEHNAFFVTESCTSNTSSKTKGPNEYYEVNLFAFNSSRVYVNYFLYQKNQQNTNYLEPAVYDTFNQLRFGNKINVTSFMKYNDTTMFISFNKKNIESFGLFVINSALEFVEVQSFNFGFNVPISAVPIYGTTQVAITLGSSAANVIYDFNINQITQVVTTVTPIFLSNGSIVNTTQYGYFIQSPGEPFYFIQAPFSNNIYNAYQDPSDLNQTYTLFVPSSSYNYYSVCLLTHFNASNSVITQTTFPNCPLSLATGNPIQIKDVKYASDGTPHVCYRDAYGSLFIVNTAGSVGPYKATYLYTVIQVSLNLTNGTANFAGTQLSSFVLGRFSISNGLVIQSVNLVANSYYNTISKVTDRFFMLAYSGTNSIFEIYDMTSFTKTYGVTSDTSITFYSALTALVYGFSDENPSNFTGLIYFTSGYIYAMNGAGKTNMINPGQSVSIYDINALSGYSFIVSEYRYYYIQLQVVYNITSWGTSSNDDKIEFESIEY